MNNTSLDCLASMGARIAQRRIQLGMSQAKLADLADVTPQFVSLVERTSREVRAGNLLNLARALNCSVDYLITGEETREEHLLKIAEELISIEQRLAEITGGIGGVGGAGGTK